MVYRLLSLFVSFLVYTQFLESTKLAIWIFWPVNLRSINSEFHDRNKVDMLVQVQVHSAKRFSDHPDRYRLLTAPTVRSIYLSETHTIIIVSSFIQATNVGHMRKISRPLKHVD